MVRPLGGRQGLHADPAQGGDPYVIRILPPNVTGILHMGHALNNSRPGRRPAGNP
ncbi:MAG: class I tRNA ligase family protein [Kiritimatiellia bacterium]